MEKIIKFCSNCNKSFLEKFSFCPICANRLEAVELKPLSNSAVPLSEASESPKVTTEKEEDLSEGYSKPSLNVQKEDIASFSTSPVTQSNNIPLRQILGLIGSIILFVGVFTPIISIPIVGNMNYFQNGRGDGVIILVLAVFSVFLILIKKYKFLLFTGIGTLAILAFTFITFQVRMSQMKSQVMEGMKNNPFGGLGEGLFNSIQLQWGWAVLIIGAVLLIAAALLKETASEIDAEQTNDTLSFGGIGGATKISDSALYTVLGIIAIGWVGIMAYSFFGSPSTPNILSTPNQQASSGATSSNTSSASPEETAYISNVSVSNVKISKTVLRQDGIFGELKNNGNKTLDKIEITIYFLDKNGNPISEKTFSPVNAAAQNFGMSDTSALKPKYSRKFGYEADAPSEWSKKVRAEVTKVVFAK